MVTEAEIDAEMTSKGGWTRESLAKWGVSWPPPKGWRKAIVEGRAIKCSLEASVSSYGVTKEQVVDTAPCPQCGKPIGAPCRVGADGRPKSHHDRLHAAQIILNERRNNSAEEA